MGLEDKKRRFGEYVVDMDLKDNERIKKCYRQTSSLQPIEQGSAYCLPIEFYFNKRAYFVILSWFPGSPQIKLMSLDVIDLTG